MQTPRGAVEGGAVFVGVCRFHTSRQVKNQRDSKLPLFPHYYERLTLTAYSTDLPKKSLSTSKKKNPPSFVTAAAWHNEKHRDLHASPNIARVMN
jgi:hypothetical protein